MKFLKSCFLISQIVLRIWIGVYLGLVPLFLTIKNLNDPGLNTGEIPAFAYQWHRAITPKIESWAMVRVESGRAAAINYQHVSATEWPIFSAVYFLWATEALQSDWEENDLPNVTEPKLTAAGAIEAAAALVQDPGHAAWVQKHWGDDYLTRENIFYRMLLIGGLTSYQSLTGNRQYESQLRTQVEGLAQELDQSPYGLLDDYPGQCYPIDILPAVAVIQRADEVLGTDHSAIIERAVRGFEDSRLDPLTGLPAYRANAVTGEGLGPARGVGISYMLIWAPEIWPETAAMWFERYENHFWESGRFISGVREYPRQTDAGDWLFEIDAGPVVGGIGTAATAFGIAAFRVNGRLSQSNVLSQQALTAAWPLANGTLLAPRILSNLSDAPYLGETALLFAFTRSEIGDHFLPPEKSPIAPGIVWVGLTFYALLGFWGVWTGVCRIRFFVYLD